MIRNAVLFASLSLCAFAWAVAQTPPPPDGPFRIPTDGSDRPFLAIWRNNEGRVRESKAPYLRVAIWDDGRVVFAKDPSKWSHDLLQGRIAAYRVERLKKALLETGVFELKGNAYLGPDAPTDCITIELGEKKQMLYWWENQMSWMQDKPHRLEFVRCWKAANALALVACPDQFEIVSERFKRPPESWYLKKAIQSE